MIEGERCLVVVHDPGGEEGDDGRDKLVEMTAPSALEMTVMKHRGIVPSPLLFRGSEADQMCRLLQEVTGGSRPTALRR